jgi:CRISPR-associated protein Cmr5
MMTQLSRQQTLEQQRATTAWELVSQVKTDPRGTKFQKEYNSWVKKVPVLILTNGLGQTLAFITSKGDGAKERLYQHLSNWLMTQMLWSPLADQKTDLLERLIHEPSATYRRATIEALAFLNWLKRFADALLEGGN